MNKTEKELLVNQEKKRKANQDEKNYFLFKEVCGTKIFNEAQKQEIRTGIEEGFTKEQLELIARPDLPYQVMQSMKEGIRYGLNQTELAQIAAVSMSLHMAIIHSVQSQMDLIARQAGYSCLNRMEKDISADALKLTYDISQSIYLQVEDTIKEHVEQFKKEHLEIEGNPSKSIDYLISGARRTKEKNNTNQLSESVVARKNSSFIVDKKGNFVTVER